MTKENHLSADIMVVDDTPANLRLLEEILRDGGYRVRAFSRGREALEAAAQKPPDLVMLDVNMPELNGYETCERFKADPWLSSVPIIFISAFSEVLDKVKAFQSGGEVIAGRSPPPPRQSGIERGKIQDSRGFQRGKSGDFSVQ